MPGMTIGTGRSVPPWLRMAGIRRVRLLSWLRLGLYLLLGAVFVAVALLMLRMVFGIRQDQNAFPPLGTLLVAQGIQVLATALLPTAVMVLAFRDGATSFGWGTGDRLRNLAIGLSSGAGSMALLVGAIAACGGASVHPAATTVGAAAVHGLVYAAVFALVAVGEEGLLRGYPLVVLSRAISFWPAAVVSCIVFALLHAPHGSETAWGLLDVAGVGLLLAYSFRRSGGLWFAWGWHAAWDFTETFVFGAVDSGVPARDSALVTVPHGAAWLSGGSAGPEGSRLVPLVLVLVAVLVRLALRPAAGGPREERGQAGTGMDGVLVDGPASTA